MEQLTLSDTPSKNIQPQQSPVVKNKTEMWQLKLAVLRQLFRLLLHKSGNPLTAFKIVHQIRKKYQNTFGEPLLSKATKVDGRYYWRLGTPGFPSKATLITHQNEINRFIPTQNSNGLRTVLFAITKKCPLNCQHCFEWNNLHQDEQLSTTDIINIVHKYQDYGTTQIMFSGGEPMLRINDLYKVLQAAKPKITDFWIITSGLGLNLERAKQLKAAGLTGVMVSLDHHEAPAHDFFRGFQGAYNWATQAVTSANQAGLVTTLSLCATKAFVSTENITAYMQLAKKLGVSFVQIVEPRATGRYSGKNVELSEKETNILEKAYLSYNSDKQFQDYPIINYLGYHQRKVGCFGSGDRFFYIDTDGDAHICPFCTKKIANTLKLSAEDTIQLLSQNACHSFANSTF